MSAGDFLEDAWDAIVDGVEYLFSFEWIGDAWEGTTEFFGSMFEGIGQFSFMGLAFAIMTVGFSYSTRYLNITGDDKGMSLIATMVQHMPPAERLFWTVASYVGAFIAGYFMGKYFENT